MSGVTIKAVAFDIDGTMYPDINLYVKIAPYFFKNLNFFIQYNKVRKILHRTAPLPDFFEYQGRLLGEYMQLPTLEARRLIDEKVYHGLCRYFEIVKPYPHVLETFQKFKEAGLKTGILSDFPPHQKGDIFGCAPYCDVIMGSEECGALKPSAYTFGILAQRLGLEPGEILYVGNSISSDIRGAKAAGMKTAYIPSGWRRIAGKKAKEADFSFRNYRQLQKIVLK